MNTRACVDAALSIARALEKWAQESDLLPQQHHPPEDRMLLFDAVVEHPDIRSASRQLYKDGHYSLAVQQASIALNCQVKAKSGSSKDGADLMFTVFSETRPILRFSRCQTESERNEQGGYAQILAGVMRGVRNPRAHEVPHVDDAGTALRLLGLIDHLHTKVDAAKRVPPSKP